MSAVLPASSESVPTPQRLLLKQLLRGEQPVLAVVLAGGQARRMGGGDKGRLVWQGRTLLDHLCTRLRPQSGAILLNANGDPQRFADLGLPVCADLPGLAGAGPLAGLLTALETAAAQGWNWVLTVPTDTPLIPADLTLRLAAVLAGQDDGAMAAVAASGGRRHPTVGLWPVSLAAALRQAVQQDGIRRAHDWLNLCPVVAADWPEEPFDPFGNLNQPGDLDRLNRDSAATAPQPLPFAAVVTAKNQSAQTLLSDFAGRRRAEEVRLSGLLQDGRKDDPAGCVFWRSLGDADQRFPMMQNLGQSGCCAVDPQAMAAAAALLAQSGHDGSALVIINKFGHLEADGGGLRAELLALMAAEQPLLTSVSIARIADWLEACGGHGVLLPPDAAALDRWWQSVGAE